MKIKFANLDFTPKEINEDQKSLRAVFSTGDVDRHGEVVDQKSWLLDDFLKNPVVLFGHDHSQPPVGKIMGLGYNSDGNLEGEVKFAALEYPFANVIWNLYKGGFMKAFSVGFSAGKVDIVDNQVILRENTLYEISTVAVPANAMALAKAKGMDVSALEAKMIEQTDKAKDETVAEVVAEVVAAPAEEVKPAEETVVEAAAEETEDDAATEEAAATDEAPKDAEEAEDAVAKGMNALVTSIKEGRVLSKKNRKAIEEALVALQAVLDADKKEQEADKKLRTDTTDLSIKVETPAVRIVVPAKGQNKAKLINKAIRALLAEKRKA